MIQSALLFGLGFLCAAFLALMIAPAIWRRAAQLTRRKIEASVPLTLNEIQADKDRMRAEFAMSTRRLEMSVKTLKEKAAAQVAEISRHRQEIRKLGEDRDEKTVSISELEALETSLRADLAVREQQLADAGDRLRQMEAKLEERALELERIRGQAEEFSVTASERQVQLVARETEMERLSSDIENLRSQRREKDKIFREHESEVKTLRKEMIEATKRLEQGDKRIAQLMTKLADREEKLDRREKDLARLREELKTTRDAIDQTTQQIVDAEQSRVELAGDLAGMSLQMGNLLEGVRDGEVEKAVSMLEKDRDRISQDLARSEHLNIMLTEQIAAFERSKSEDWQEQKQQNALLREQINDLTAEVVRLTAEIEGPDSPIHAALESKSSLEKAGLEQDPQGQVISLAERVRALQKSASSTAD